MGSPEMTSVSVSFGVRRQLNQMRSMGDFRSVDDLLQHMVKVYRTNLLGDDRDSLNDSLAAIADVDVADLVERLELSPFKG